MDLNPISSQRSGLLICPHCKKSQGEFKEINLDYFNEIHPLCQHCNTKIDMWEAIVNAVKHRINPLLCDVLAAIGAKMTGLHFKIVQSGQVLLIKFEDYGIPKNAIILEVNHTSGSHYSHNCLFPFELRDSPTFDSTRRRRKKHYEKLYFYPVPEIFDANKPSGSSVLNWSVTWVPKSIDDELWQYLIDALEAYIQDDFKSCILPANVAVESKLMRLINKYLTQYCGKKHVKEFLDNAATYSHQLNVMLPLAADHIGIPTLPDNIRGLLNKLRKLRNQVAHSGKPEAEISNDQCAELIVSALFGFHYLNLFERKLDSR